MCERERGNLFISLWSNKKKREREPTKVDSVGKRVWLIIMWLWVLIQLVVGRSVSTFAGTLWARRPVLAMVSPRTQLTESLKLSKKEKHSKVILRLKIFQVAVKRFWVYFKLDSVLTHFLFIWLLSKKHFYHSQN